MKTYFRFVLISVFSLLILSSDGYSQYKKKVDGEGIKSIISLIASDEYKGRETGSKGGDMVEEYFESEFKKLGLKPAGENGSYYHYYFLSKEPLRKVDGTPSLVIGDRIFYYGYNEDFREDQYTDGGDVSGEVVYADFGIFSPTQKRNDFENIDISGKIVLAKRGCPNDDWDKWKTVASDSVKAEYCSKKGALALLLFEQAANPFPELRITSVSESSFTNSLSKSNPVKNFPVLIVDARVARYLGVSTSFRFSMMGGQSDPKSESRLTGKSGKISLKINVEQPKKVRNVLAMIPGTDSKLKNEVVIIGGHIDHVGVNSKGEVNNGADDNASGPAVALGVAQAMVKNKFKPKRTVIFAGWSGEEKGLLGSEAWCKNPTWDLSKIVVYFNLDMVGLGDGKLNFPGIYYGADVWEFLKKNTDTSYLNKINPSKGGPGGSDHNSFLYAGVPGYAGMTSGSHPDYHQPGDDAEKIKPEILQFVGDWSYHSIDVIANSKENFIAQDRNSIVKFLMANAISIYPLNAEDTKSVLEDKNITTVFTNYSEKLEQNNNVNNFVTALRMIDDLIKPGQRRESGPVDIAAMVSGQGRGRTVPTPVLELRSFGYDELFCKALAKNGAKIGYIGNDAPFVKDSIDKNRSLRNIMDAGMVIFLKDLSSNEILNVLAQVEKPVAIMNSDINVLNEEIIKKIKSKGHLFIYNISAQIPVNEVVTNLESIKSKIENKNYIFANPSFGGKPAYEKMKEIYIALDKKNSTDDFQNKVFSGNYNSFYQKAIATTRGQVGGQRIITISQ